MSESTPSLKSRVGRWLGLALFGATIAFNVWAVCVGWHSGLLQGNEFRQTQTGLTALFVQREGNFSPAYPTPVLGKPWSIPMEFPLYQWTVAAYSSATGAPIIQAGRAVSYVCFLLGLPAVWLLTGQLNFTRAQRLIVLAMLLTCPLYIFYARALLIETMALMFGLWFLQAWVAALRQRSIAWAIAANVAGIGAGLVKVTTFMLYLLPAALAVLWLCADQRPRGHASARSSAGFASLLPWALACTVIPFTATIWWIHFSDALKMLNPAGAQLVSSALSSYNFGTLAIRLEAATWLSHWKTVSTNLTSVPALVIFAIAVVGSARQRRKWIALALLVFVSGPLTFPVLYSWHEYYFVANAAWLMIAMGLATGSWFETSRPRWIVWSLVLLLPAVQLWNYVHNFYPSQRLNHEGGSGLTRLLRDMTKPDDVMIIAGNDWTSVIPFYAERRALMLRRGFESDGSYLPRAFSDLKGESVAVLVLVADQRANTELVERAARVFGIDPQPFVTHLDQTLYVSKERRAEFAGRLVNIYYDDVQFSNPAERLTSNEPSTITANTMRFFDVMTPRPYRYQVPFGLAFRNLPTGDRCFDAHATTRIWFHAPPGAQRIVAEFGIIDEAFARPAARTDGIEFSVQVRSTNGTEQTVFSRVLDPAADERDRGVQRLDITLPDEAAAEITFATGPGPSGSNAFDWAYWKRIEIR